MGGRAAMSKLVAPRMDITVDKAGEFGTTDFTMTFKKDGKTISPWHDIPLEAGDGMYNFVCEIPKMSLKKMEVRPGRPCPQPQSLWVTRACTLLAGGDQGRGQPDHAGREEGQG